MATPEFVLALREKIGHDPLWLIGVTAVVLSADQQQVLLVRRSDNGQWTPVTGIVDPGEHPREAAARETLEETGTTITVEGLTQVSVTEPIIHVNGDQAQYLNHTYRARYVSGHAHPADDESSDVRWFPLSDLPPMRTEMIQRVNSAK